MRHLLKTALPVATTLVLCLSALPALADSTSSASSASSTSLGSSSASIGKSSDSSSSRDRVAQGPYTVVDLVAVADQPGMLQVRLQALNTGDTPSATPAFTLVLPREAAERGQLVPGQVVVADHRPYGLALTTANTGGPAAPFFLVLDDDWHRELESRPVVL